MKPTVLIGTAMAPAFLERLRQDYEIIGPLGGAPQDLLDAGQREPVQALVTIGSVGMDAAMLDALPSLKLVVCMGVGVERVDRAALARRGGQLANSAGANAASVADYALALLLASVRGVAEADRFVRAGEWRMTPTGRTRLATRRGMTGRKVGVVGLGAIGRKVADRVAAFEAEVGYVNPSARDAPYRCFPDVLALAAWADTLVIAVRADRTNRHMIDAAVLTALGPEGHIVNISRGSAIDEVALVEALRTGMIAGAGLDVFEDEPALAPGLAELPNVVFSPHQAGSASEAQAAMQAMVTENLRSFFETGRPATPVP